MIVTAVLLVIIIIFLIDYLKNNNKHISEVIIATGTTIMLSSFVDLTQLFFILLSYLNNEQINFLEYTKSNIDYTSVILGLVIVIVGLVIKKTKEIDLINIFTFDDKKPEIKDINNVRENKMDIISLYDELNRNEGKNVDVFVNEFNRKLKTYNLEHKNSRNAYTGIASIPLVLYAGTKLKGNDFEVYYEYDKKKEKYEKLKSFSKCFPLDLEFDEKILQNKTEIVLAFGITTKIKDTDLVRFKNISKRIYNIKREEETKDNSIKSISQLRKYTTQIYNILREIPKEYPKLEKIHLVISAQSCLIIELGKLIDDRNLPKIISYQFVFNDKLKYPWGLVINGEEAGKYVGKK